MSLAGKPGRERTARMAPSALGGLLNDDLRYCVLHGRQSPPAHFLSDLDIVVAPGDLPELEARLASRRNVRITQLRQYETTGFYFVVARQEAGRAQFSTLDAAVDYRVDGRLFFTAAELLAGSREIDGVRVAAPEVEFGYLVVKKICKGRIPEHQRTQLQRLYAALPDSDGILRRLLGLRAGREAADCLARGDWWGLNARLPRLHRALRAAAVARDPLNPVRYWVQDLSRRWSRWRRPTGVCVALLGPDGAGKSTLIGRLQKDLAGAGFRRAWRFHLRPRLRPLTSEGSPAVDPHARAPYPRWLSVLKLGYYGAAFLLGYVLIVRPRLVRSGLVLFDRYYDDLLVDPRRYRYGGPMAPARLVRAFAPRPDLCLVLDLPEAETAARKREVPIEELRRQRDGYRRLAAESPNAVLLDASLPPDELARRAGDVVVEYLHERYVRRRRATVGRHSPASTLRWLSFALCDASGDAYFAFRSERSGSEAAAPPAERFGWLSLGDGRAYLVPLGSARASRALELYKPQNLKGACAKALFSAGLRFRMGRTLLPEVQLVHPGPDSAANDDEVHILDHLKQVLRREDLMFGISAGTPGPGRKPVLLVLDGTGRPIAYVKVGCSEAARALVRREAAVLRLFGAHPPRSFSAPALLHFGCWSGRSVLVQSVGPAGPDAGGRRDGFRYTDVPRELAGFRTRWTPLPESRFWASILSLVEKIPNTYYRETVEHAARAAEDRFGAQPLPFHLSHGDFTPWNMQSDGGRGYVFDWEQSQEDGLPGQDILHFHFQQMRCVRRWGIEAAYEAFRRTGAARTAVSAHLAALGVPAVPPEWLFYLYRLQQLAGEAADPRPGAPSLWEFALLRKIVEGA